MKRNTLANAERKFIWISGVLVILLGAPILSSFTAKTEIQAKLIEHPMSSRAPASREGAVPVEVKKTSQKTAVLDLDCDFTAPARDVTSSYIRVSGKSCAKTHLNGQALEILNTTNGFSAAVIFGKNKQFTTDFIDLQEGSNAIRVVAQLEDGTRLEKTLHVNRRSLASIPDAKPAE